MRKIEDSGVPNLQRYIYPSGRVPRVSFAETALPVCIPPSVTCVDTTLSLGLAALQPCTVEQRLQIYQLLQRLNGDDGLIRRVELRLRDDDDRAVLARALELHASGENSLEPTISVESPAQLAVLGTLRPCEIGLSLPTSDLQILLGHRHSRREAVEWATRLIDACLEAGALPRLELLDVCRADLDGFLFPALESFLGHVARRAASLRLRLCDSFGLALPWPEAPINRSLPRLLLRLRKELSLQPEQLEVQAHDDLGLALANTLAAATHGCATVVGSIGGVGERAGIASTELLLVHLGGLYGVESELATVADLLHVLGGLGLRLAARHPLWGEDALRAVSPFPPEVLRATPELCTPFNTNHVYGRTPNSPLPPSGADASRSSSE
jgi:citrate (Re)-synthase